MLCPLKFKTINFENSVHNTWDKDSHTEERCQCEKEKCEWWVDRLKWGKKRIEIIDKGFCAIKLIAEK